LKQVKLTSLAIAVATLVAMSAHAEDANLSTLQRMQTTTANMNIPVVPQEGKNADAIRANLKKVKLPDGFKIELYAVVPDARYMAVAPSTNMLFVGTRKSTVWAVTNRNNGDTATEVKAFAPSIKFSNPNGVCFTKDGFLIVTESNRILKFAAAEYFYETPDVAVDVVVPEGKLIPVEEQSFNHSARTCKIAPDGKMFVTMGQPYNVQPAGKVKMYEDLGMGGVLRFNGTDGTGRMVYAKGMRNPAGLTIGPKGDIWTTDNQVDGMGDDIPPGELNKIAKAGDHYGFPYWNGHVKIAGSSAAPDLKDMKEPVGAVFPQVEFPAHQAQLGITHYTGKAFPAKYQSGMFIAAHGSWNRSTPNGYEVQFVPIKADGNAGPMEVFASGFLDKATGRALARPVDVANLPDGSILVSDDYAGALYRISYASN
jgi:glucose/arabinose dehydrogenase